MDAASGSSPTFENFEPDRRPSSCDGRSVGGRTAADPMVNTAVIAGGLVNALARYGEPDDVLCLLADDFTATLADGTIVTLEDLRDGTVDPEALGYGVTVRETIGVRGERLALTRIENARWSIEQLDDHDRLIRVTVFAHEDLLGAANALDHAARQLAENAHIPEWAWEFQRAHRNYDLDALADTLSDAFVQTDHRPMGYVPMGKAELIELIRTGLDDPTLRAVPVYSVMHELVDGGGLVRGGLWMRGTSDDYWTGQPYLNVVSAVNGRLVSSDLYPLDNLDAANARLHHLNHGTRPPDRLWNDAHRRSSELHDAPLEPVAVRGDHLVLYHLALRTGSLSLDQWSAEGQLERTASFEPGDLAGAVRELNARYADEVGFDPVKLASFQSTSCSTHGTWRPFWPRSIRRARLSITGRSVGARAASRVCGIVWNLWWPCPTTT